MSFIAGTVGFPSAKIVSILKGHDYVNISLVKTGIERETEKVLENLSKTSDALKQKEFSLASIENEIIENEKTSLEQVAITFDNFLDKLTCQR